MLSLVTRRWSASSRRASRERRGRPPRAGSSPPARAYHGRRRGLSHRLDTLPAQPVTHACVFPRYRGTRGEEAGGPGVVAGTAWPFRTGWQRASQLMRAGRTSRRTRSSSSRGARRTPPERDFFQGLVHVTVAWYQAGRGQPGRLRAPAREGGAPPRAVRARAPRRRRRRACSRRSRLPTGRVAAGDLALVRRRDPAAPATRAVEAERRAARGRRRRAATRRGRRRAAARARRAPRRSTAWIST